MVEVKSSILPVLEQIEQLHKIKKEEVIKYIEESITLSAKKFFGSNCHIVTEIDVNTGDTKTYLIKKVVEKVSDKDREIAFEEAQKYYPDVKVGNEIKILIDNESFTRIAARDAKRIILQKFRESNKMNILAEYESQVGNIVSATVYNILGKTIIVDLGKVEGLMPQREQVFKEKFRIGQHIRVLIKSVEKTKKGIRVIVSRMDKEFIKKLFESEIPEIKDGTVEILNIVRAPGYRTKIVVKSNNPKVDPVGTCVGVKGTRIKPIIDELQGERIDLIPYTDNTAEFIKFALSPMKVEEVVLIDEKNKIAKAYVQEKIYDSVIPKNNININLTKELTGWNITFEPYKEKEDKSNSKTNLDDTNEKK